MSFFKLKDYIKKSEDVEGFVEDEIARFAKHLPGNNTITTTLSRQHRFIA